MIISILNFRNVKKIGLVIVLHFNHKYFDYNLIEFNDVDNKVSLIGILILLNLSDFNINYV